MIFDTSICSNDVDYKFDYNFDIVDYGDNIS